MPDDDEPLTQPDEQPPPLIESKATATGGAGAPPPTPSEPKVPTGAPGVVGGDEMSPGEIERERDELTGTLQRVQADFENFRKRIMRDQAAQLDRAHEGLVEQLLPVLDSFELAVLNVPSGDLDEVTAKLKKGLELVYAELFGVLERAGLERLDATGKPFDPEQHEAVLRDEGDGAGEPVVREVMRTGYRLKGRVLRPAMVRVGPAPT